LKDSGHEQLSNRIQKIPREIGEDHTSIYQWEKINFPLNTHPQLLLVFFIPACSNVNACKPSVGLQALISITLFSDEQSQSGP